MFAQNNDSLMTNRPNNMDHAGFEDVFGIDANLGSNVQCQAEDSFVSSSNNNDYVMNSQSSLPPWNTNAHDCSGSIFLGEQKHFPQTNKPGSHAGQNTAHLQTFSNVQHPLAYAMSISSGNLSPFCAHNLRHNSPEARFMGMFSKDTNFTAQHPQVNDMLHSYAWTKSPMSPQPSEILVKDSKGKLVKPKRPLSAFNYFFSYERARILGSPVNDKLGERASKYHRRHRRSHGRIGFKDLAKHISQRWKQIDSHSLAFFEEKAALDLKRYRRAMKAYKEALAKEQIEREISENGDNEMRKETENQGDSKGETQIGPRRGSGQKIQGANTTCSSPLAAGGTAVGKLSLNARGYQKNCGYDEKSICPLSNLSTGGPIDDTGKSVHQSFFSPTDFTSAAEPVTAVEAEETENKLLKVGIIELSQNVEDACNDGVGTLTVSGGGGDGDCGVNSCAEMWRFWE